MLQSVVLEFTETGRIVVPTDGVTVFVGPNNAGKSLVLREIEEALSHNHAPQGRIVRDFEIVWPTPQQVAADLDRLKMRAPPGTPTDAAYIGRFLPNGNLDAVTINRNAVETLAQRQEQVLVHFAGSQVLPNTPCGTYEV